MPTAAKAKPELDVVEDSDGGLMPTASKAEKKAGTRVETDSLGEKVQEYLRELELGRYHYKKADQLMDELELEMTPGEVVQLSAKKVATMTDRGSRFNVGMNARRFQIKVTVS